MIVCVSKSENGPWATILAHISDQCLAQHGWFFVDGHMNNKISSGSYNYSSWCMCTWGNYGYLSFTRLLLVYDVYATKLTYQSNFCRTPKVFRFRYKAFFHEVELQSFGLLAKSVIFSFDTITHSI